MQIYGDFRQFPRNFFDSSQSCMDNRLIFGQIEEIHPKLVQNERGDWLQWHSPGLSQRLLLFLKDMQIISVFFGSLPFCRHISA
jgi:hypothetical protein